MAAQRVEPRELAQRDRVLDAVAGALGEREAAQELRVRLVEPPRETERDAEPDRQLHRDVAERRLAARLLERGLDQRQGRRGIAPVDLDLGHELAGELRLAAGAGPPCRPRAPS